MDVLDVLVREVVQDVKDATEEEAVQDVKDVTEEEDVQDAEDQEVCGQEEELTTEDHQLEDTLTEDQQEEQLQENHVQDATEIETILDQQLLQLNQEQLQLDLLLLPSHLTTVEVVNQVDSL